MPNPVVLAIDMLGIDSIKLAHALRQIGLSRLQHQVIVVTHLTPRMADPVETIAHLRQHREPSPAVCVVKVDVFAPITA
jgi:CheY-like chemotaxis protein